jgi:membrane-associated phospholipid phosphatase
MQDFRLPLGDVTTGSWKADVKGANKGMRFSQRLNWTDLMLASFFVALGSAVLYIGADSAAWFLPTHAFILALIAVLSLAATKNRLWRFAHDWYPVFVFISAFEEVARLSLTIVPHWQDQIILRWETAIFPVPPTEVLHRWSGAIFTEVLEFGYFTFYWIMPVVGGILYPAIWQAKTPSEASGEHQPFRIWMNATVLGYMICYAFYLFFPTEGPAHTLPRMGAQTAGGPFHWLVLLIQRYGGVHGNAFPSGHIMASTIALLAALRWKPRLGYLLIVPVLLMCVGAVYDGYHYFSDVVAGALLGAAVFWLVVLLSRSASCRGGVNLMSP